MFQKYVLPLVAAGTLIFAVYHVLAVDRNQPEARPANPPPTTPYSHTVAGSGIIEAQSENISIGSHVPGIVVEVHVKTQQAVQAGQPLFSLDDRQMRAELRVRQAELSAAEAQLARLQGMPRPEELPAAKARVNEAEANFKQATDQLQRAEPLERRGAITEGELIRWRQAEASSRAQLARAKAEFELLTAGAWEADKEVSRAAVEQVKAQVQKVQTELDRLVVRAPIDGTVLQCHVRPGEFVGALPGQPLIVLGNVRQFHVRVDIDEHDIPRFHAGAPALAELRGNPQERYPLKFVRVEPYVIPKRSLTGDNTERVDTRVLQVLYVLDPQGKPLYVGQQVDVSIEVPDGQPVATAGARRP